MNFIDFYDWVVLFLSHGKSTDSTCLCVCL